MPLVYDTLRLVMGMLDNGASTKRLRHLHGSALERSMHGSTSALFSDMFDAGESRFAPPTTLVGDNGIPHATLTEIFPVLFGLFILLTKFFLGQLRANMSTSAYTRQGCLFVHAVRADSSHVGH